MGLIRSLPMGAAAGSGLRLLITLDTGMISVSQPIRVPSRGAVEWNRLPRL
jgi:hypothetical protein